MRAVDINIFDKNGDPELVVRLGYDGKKILTLFSDDPIATERWLADGFEWENSHGNVEFINGDNGLDFLNMLKYIFDGFHMRATDVYDLKPRFKNR